MQAANPPERKAQIQSVERAIWILQCFYDHKELHVIEISELLGLNKSTTMGLVRTLQAYQFLTRNPETGKYRLGSELFRLGSKVDADLQNLVTPYINELADQFHETVNLMVLDGTSLLRVVKRESVHSLRNTSQTGRREPLHLSAGGKAMLAAMSPDRARSILDNSVFVRYTDTTLRCV